MKNVIRGVIAIVSAILGAGVALLLDLTVGGGIDFIPFSSFIWVPLLGAIIGFVFGVYFYRSLGQIIIWISNFIG